MRVQRADRWVLIMDCSMRLLNMSSEMKRSSSTLIWCKKLSKTELQRATEQELVHEASLDVWCGSHFAIIVFRCWRPNVCFGVVCVSNYCDLFKDRLMPICWRTKASIYEMEMAHVSFSTVVDCTKMNKWILAQFMAFSGVTLTPHMTGETLITMAKELISWNKLYRQSKQTQQIVECCWRHEIHVPSITWHYLRAMWWHNFT